MGSYIQTVPDVGSFAFFFTMRLQLGEAREVTGRIAWTRCAGPCQDDDYVQRASLTGVEVVEGNVGADDIIRVHGTALEPEGSELALDEYELTVDNRGIITVRSRGVPPMEPWAGAVMVGVKGASSSFRVAVASRPLLARPESPNPAAQCRLTPSPPPHTHNPRRAVPLDTLAPADVGYVQDTDSD